MALLHGKPVVVPWDFSDHSRSALRRALELVSEPGQIQVVYVMHAPVTADPGVYWEVASREAMHQQASEAFQKELGSHPEFAGVQFISLIGDPGSQIAEHAAKTGAELIVISSHGRTGLTRWMLGSVAERVVRLARCEVLVQKAATPES